MIGRVLSFHCAFWGMSTFFYQALLGSVGRGGKHVILQLGYPSNNGCWHHSVVVSFAATSTQLCCNGSGEGRCLFLERNCFSNSYAPGHFWGLQPTFSSATTLAGVQWMANCISGCLPYPSPDLPSLLLLICPPSDVLMRGSFRHVCMLSRDSLLNH